jgi:tryptophan synthase alpha chain
MVSLHSWSTTEKCFDFMERNINKIESKLLIMTYYNIVFNYWVEKFVKKASEIWIYWLIVPDVPFDENDWEKLIDICKKYNINLIQIVSPSVEKNRLEKISNISSGFVYAVSQNMTTWSNWNFEWEFKKYINNLKKEIKIKIWVWFWVKTKEDVNKVCNVSDFAIIWSEVIKKYDKEWIEWIEKYFKKVIK